MTCDILDEYNIYMCSVGNIIMGSVWTGVFLLLLRLSTVSGVHIIPCGDDGVVEVLSGQNTSFTCKSEGNVLWRLLNQSNNHNQAFILSNCTENGCKPAFFGETFVASVRDNDTKVMTVNAVNNTKIFTNVQLVNGSVECDVVKNGRMNQSVDIVRSASCGLNYVYPSDKVECNAAKTTSSISVSCVIGSVYSSRRVYKCHLFQRSNGLCQNRLETVTMVTSPTSEKITKTEVKVSGSCQFNTTLPPDKGFYGFVVSISPGGRNYSVTMPMDDEGTTIDTTCDTNHCVKIFVGVTSVLLSVVILLIIHLVIQKKNKGVPFLFILSVRLSAVLKLKILCCEGKEKRF
ncbi:uncharacterized protein LOC112569174 [Pomacea canaliculata]|uniref:uncharacterized protein LOC112569174 n=1 Tax=Pomacea canaliculata TaxID=400727 RepID=UPI000D7366E1|nr:uncharacterized protein LOC112569174 [Pomacea canaliculata]